MSKLDFSALDRAHKEYEEALTNGAHECSEMIKQITQKFIELNVDEEISVHCGEDEGEIYWEPKASKIMFFPPEVEAPIFLAGANRKIRCRARPHLEELIREAARRFS